MRTTGARGLDTWVIGSVASGTPPKGQCQRNNSASTNAPGSATRLPTPPGATAAAAPKSALANATVTM